MKLYFIIFCFSLLLAQTPNYVQSPKPVDYVDPKSFSGLWYEIARTYNSFEDGCVAASVEYKLVEPLKYEVTNRCFKEKIGGELIVYNGTAQPANGNTMSQIEKTYFWIFSKDYRIIYLDDYKTAIMSDKDMKNLWIMNREPIIEKEKLDSLILLLSKHMDTKELIFTPQDKNGRYK